MIKESGGTHPLASSELLYLPRTSGSRRLRSVEAEYKLTKVKAAVKLFSKRDDTMSMVRTFEEKSEEKGRRFLKNDAMKYAAEMGVSLQLTCPVTQRFTIRQERRSRKRMLGRNDGRNNRGRQIRQYKTSAGKRSSSKNSGGMKL